MSTFTPNINLEQVARGADVGTWDTPTNANWAVTDLAIGGSVSIALTNTNVVLSAAQFQARRITFTGALSGTILITFPTSYVKDYEIENLCTNNNSFHINLIAAGSQIGCPPGQIVEVVNTGGDMKYKNLPPVGSYMDYAGTTVPGWIANSGVNPWLMCNGGTFSAVTYPILAEILGGTTLPDRRGTVAAMLDQSAGRLTNFSGLLTVGGDQSLQAHSHTNTVGTESANHSHQLSGGAQIIVGQGTASFAGGGSNNTPTTGAIIGPNTGIESAAHNHIVTINAAGGGNSQNVQPTTIVGITLIRAG